MQAINEIDREIRLKNKELNSPPDTMEIKLPSTPMPTPYPTQSPTASPYPSRNPTPGQTPSKTPSVEECVQYPSKLTKDERLFLAVIASEADLGNPAMMEAVAWSIINRMNSPYFGYVTSPSIAIKEPGQYTGFKEGVEGSPYENAQEYFRTGVYPRGKAGTEQRMKKLIENILPICRGSVINDISQGLTNFADPRNIPRHIRENPNLYVKITIPGVSDDEMLFWRREDH